MTHASRIAVLATLVAITAACSPATSTPPASATVSPTVSPTAARAGLTFGSPDLGADGYLPEWAANDVPGYCDGTGNQSPRFEWTGVPDGTVELVLTLTDPAAAEYVHWVHTDIDPTSLGLEAALDGMVSDGVTGVSWEGPGIYAGPCIRNRTYEYTLYALDTDIAADIDTDLDELTELMVGHILDQASFPVKVR